MESPLAVFDAVAGADCILLRRDIAARGSGFTVAHLILGKPIGLDLLDRKLGR
jgi:hypothetical protein